MSEGTAELIAGIGTFLIGAATCVFADRLAALSRRCSQALFGVRVSPTWERVHMHFTRWGGLACALWGMTMLVFDVP